MTPGACWSEHESLVERTDHGGGRHPNKWHRNDPQADRIGYRLIEQVVERPLDGVELLCRVGKRDSEVILIGEHRVHVRPITGKPVSQSVEATTALGREVGP